jgi:hypothetical protein
MDMPEEPELPPSEPTVDEVVDRVRRAAVRRKLGVADDGAESVDARLIYFGGGYWAPFTPDHRVNSVTHLFGGSQHEPSSDALREVPASELRVGDKIIVVRGSEHDAIRHAADAVLSPGKRAAAAEWQRAIRRFLESGRSLVELRRKLEVEGCARASLTIRNWANDDRVIGPMGAEDGTLNAIQRATGDQLLKDRMDECLAAISLVRGTHLSIAHRLAEQVLATAHAHLDDLEASDEAVELDDRLLLLTVESVDTKVVPVPRQVVNRLREGEDTE